MNRRIWEIQLVLIQLEIKLEQSDLDIRRLQDILNIGKI